MAPPLYPRREREKPLSDGGLSWLLCGVLSEWKLMALQLMTNTRTGKISGSTGSTGSTIHTPDLRIYVYGTQHTEVRILLHYFNLLYDKPIGPAALTLWTDRPASHLHMDRPTVSA
jgi:hypothetical protein